MNPFAAIAVKTVGAAGVAALLATGAVGALAASPSPSPSSTASAAQPAGDRHADRRAIRRAIVESEADVLGVTPKALVKDLRAGQKVSDLARDKGMTKDQFAAKLAANLKPRLQALVEHRVITQAQADKTLDRISKGFIPFWDGLKHPKK